ncbi:outer membrane protein assembly factor BamC [Candidatus Pantoea edessiphila]|uniref:Lipoprotein n=1 Tax=Candidatus Pantoea edessiphila TaxID=2044610 RepID=A0A2P5SWK4_9GAMM|nr:outer membrane protein assembly factor BamC [Candidatus Pantoea edessiphila]PPI86691.1 hypothetical protein CRV10_00290 [Candidatus Pantoea edessiphila]
MNYLLKNSNCILIAKCFIIILVLSSCSYNQFDQYYLKTDKLSTLKSPQVVVLPVNKDVSYIQNFNNTFNNNQDRNRPSYLYPPMQPLQPTNGLKINVHGNKGLLFINHKKTVFICSKIIDLVKHYNFPIISINEKLCNITTDLIKLPVFYDNRTYSGKYHFSLHMHNSQLLLDITLIELKKGGDIISSPIHTTYYTTQMLNNFITYLTHQDKHYTKVNKTQIIDEHKLIMLKIDNILDTMWHRLGNIIKFIEAKINYCEQIKSSFNKVYKKIHDSFWKPVV